MEIEKLDFEVKTYNRLKKAGISTTDDLVEALYSREQKISAPDAKKCEAALKDAGIIRFMRGDYVTDDDIAPEPLTWDELHSYIGKLVVFDCSTESHRWLKVNWIYDIKDDDEGTVICSDGSRDYSYIRRSQVNGDYSRDSEFLKNHEYLKYEGRFFALKQEQEVKTVSETQVMSADYTKAVSLTRKIKANAAAAQESLWEVCKGLKEMHDGKLYKELGYPNFEEYSENEVGIKRKQAHKYISIAGVENVQSTTHFEQLGTEKLYLLSRLDEPQREAIQQTTDLENTSVKELKAKISELEKEKGKLIDDIKRAGDEKAGYKERQDKLLQKNMELVSDVEKCNKERAEIFDKLERTEGERDRLEDDLDEAKDTIKSLEQQLEELENKPHDSYEDTTKIEALKAKLAEAEKRADENNKSAYNDNAVFSAYASAATDAMKRLTQFCERRGDSSEKTVFIAKLKMIVTLTEQTIEKIGG